MIHLASCLLLFAWLRRYSGEDGLSLAVTLLFAIHPLRVESVIWVTERKDVLSLFFYLLTIWFYSAWTRADGQKRRTFYVLSLVAAVLGILSKPSLMTLPLILLLVDIWPLDRLGWSDRKNRRLLMDRIVEKLPFALLALTAATIAWFTWSGNQFIGEPPNLSLPLRTGFAGLAYLSYLARTVLPVDLVPFLPYPMSIPKVALGGAAGVIAGITILILWRLPRFPWLAAGWLWFLAAILPASGLVMISDHFAPDRYTYLAHVGLFVALIWGVATWGRRRGLSPALGWGALSFILVTLSILTTRQSLVWRDSESLWSHTLEAKGANYVAHNQLGLILIHSGRFEEGISELQAAMTANPGFPLPIANLARARVNQGNLEEAVRLMRQAGPHLPDREGFRNELLRRLEASGKKDLAVGIWRDILAEDPGDPAKRLGAAEFFYRMGDEGEAMLQYESAIGIDPENSQAALNLGALLIKRGSLDQAIPLLERSVLHAPDDGAAADAHRTLAQARLLRREWPQAIASYEQSLTLSPDRDVVRNELAQLLLDCPEASLRNPQRALTLAEPLGVLPKETGEPANPRFLRTLSSALQANGKTDRAKQIAAAGLAAVAALSEREPLEKPWTKEELEGLAKGFRVIAGIP